MTAEVGPAHQRARERDGARSLRLLRAQSVRPPVRRQVNTCDLPGHSTLCSSVFSDWALLLWAIALLFKEVHFVVAQGMSAYFCAPAANQLLCSMSAAGCARHGPPRCLHFQVSSRPRWPLLLTPRVGGSRLSSTDDIFNAPEFFACLLTVGALLLGVCHESSWPYDPSADNKTVEVSTFMSKDGVLFDFWASLWPFADSCRGTQVPLAALRRRCWPAALAIACHCPLLAHRF